MTQMAIWLGGAVRIFVAARALCLRQEVVSSCGGSASLQLRVALRKPTRLNAHATMTAIQLAQNGITTPFKVTDHSMKIRSSCRSVISAKMAAASMQKDLVVTARLPTRE